MRISGVILSGGKSSRMEENKAFVKVGGKRIIDIIVERLSRYFDDIVIITNQPEIYQDLGVKVASDVIPHQGPLSGLHAGLIHTDGDAIFAVACDMPFINMDLAFYMIDLLPGFHAVAPLVKGRFQPLFAVYGRSCLPIFEDCLLHGRLKVSRVYQEELNVKYISHEEVARFGDADVIFCNVNSPEKLRKAQEIAKRVIL